MARAALAPSLAALLALGAAGCVRGVGTPREPDVESFELRGVKAFDPGDIEEKLATQNPVAREGIAGVFVKDRQRFDPDALAVDRRRVEAYYRERGYYDARVDDVEVLPAGPGLVRVILHVHEGEPVRVAKLVIEGLDDAPEARAKLGQLPLRVGSVFTWAAYDATRAAIVNALRSTGWALGEVTQAARVQPDALTAEVTYTAKAGERYRFGAIFVAGAGSVPRGLIREQADAVIHPGDWWDESKLARAQSRVFDLGVLGGVRVVHGPVNEARRTIDVVVAVREAPFRTLRAGPGLNFDARRWEADALFGWTHRNFMGGLRRVSTDVRVGYAWLPTPFSPAKQSPVGLLGLEYRQPAAITRYLDTQARLELERGLEEAYDYWSERLKLGLPLRIVSRWSFVPSYNIEVYQLSNYGSAFTPPQLAAYGEPQLEGCNGSVCLLSYLEQRVAWDGRDDPINTHRGFWASLSFQEGFRIGSYGYRYLRIQPELRAFRPLHRGIVLAIRASIGALLPINESALPPLVGRFTAGGPLSMRGYYTRRYSLQVRQGNDWVPVGGNGVADGSVELRFDIVGNLGGVVFLDAASIANASSAWHEWEVVLDPANLQYAAGVGVRYRTPFGPFGVDVATRLPTGPPGERFPPVPYTFWPDGTPHSEPIVAVHITLGEAF